MNRLFALGLIVTLGGTSTVFAGEPLLVSAIRLARETSSTPAASSTSDGTATKELGVTSFAKAAGVDRPALAAQQAGGAVSSTGMKRSTKALIIGGAAAAFFGVAYGIDHRVKDVTPSSLGQRHDEDVFKK
jgi:hypothetical protein